MSIDKLFAAITWSLATATAAAHMPALEDGQIVAGYVENVWLAGGDIPFQAKLDSGANSGSINAPDPQVIHRDGRYWIRFTLTNSNGQSQRIEAPIKNTVRIRRAGTEKARRFLVELHACVGGVAAYTEFSLADRRNQRHQVLIGRKFLGDRVLIDPSSQFHFANRCDAR